MDENRSETVVILIPVYDDWAPVEMLLYELDKSLESQMVRATVLLVDDGSTSSIPATFLKNGLQVIRQVDVLELKRNLGHQRAIVTGLVFICEHLSGSMVLVMDGDGEDGPEDVPTLLESFHKEGGSRIVFAERSKRSESFTFKLFYQLYKALHVALTGVKVRVGNFSVIPFGMLSRLVVIAEMWNHYAAAVFNAKLAYGTVPIPRRTRIYGKSHMSFVSLVIHGLSAISVYGQVVGVRLLAAASVFIALIVALVAGTMTIRMMTNLAIPGWATFTGGLLIVMLLQTVAMSFMLVFMILYSRSNSTVIPIRDCPLFIGRLHRVFSDDRV